MTSQHDAEQLAEIVGEIAGVVALYPASSAVSQLLGEVASAVGGTAREHTIVIDESAIRIRIGVGEESASAVCRDVFETVQGWLPSTESGRTIEVTAATIGV
jgi:hypothetical protein